MPAVCISKKQLLPLGSDFNRDIYHRTFCFSDFAARLGNKPFYLLRVAAVANFRSVDADFIKIIACFLKSWKRRHAKKEYQQCDSRRRKPGLFDQSSIFLQSVHLFFFFFLATL